MLRRNKYIIDELFNDDVDGVRYIMRRAKKDVNGRLLNIDYELALGNYDEYLNIIIYDLSKYTCNDYFIINGLVYTKIYVKSEVISSGIRDQPFKLERCEMPDEITKLMNIIASKL